MLGGLQDRLAPSREVVLHGPRGNGKTALLVWLQREAAAYPGVDVLRLTPADLPDETRLVERLLPISWLQRLAPSEISFQGITWRPGQGHPPPPLDEALDARTRKKPLVLLLDEAHTLAEQVGCTLLNASQQVGRELPFLLVLAGTPNLRSHLNTMNASFWSRADRRPVGRLDSEATAAAIREPLQSEDIAIDEDALAHVVRESHGYPYFVQLWGDALWRRAVEAVEPDARRLITRSAAERSRPPSTARRTTTTSTATRSWRSSNCCPLRERWRTPSRRGRCSTTRVRGGGRRVGASDNADEVTAAKDAMRDLGYVWRPEATPMWELPSLMDYDRYEELEKLQLLPVAVDRAVADAFDTQPLLDDAAFGAAVVRGVGGRQDIRVPAKRGTRIMA